MSTSTAQLPEAGARQATLEVTEDLAWKAKILLVDDNPENLLALEAVLESPEHDLVKANSGIEALRYLLEEDFAAIRTGRANPAMFSKIMVDYYGSPTPLQQLASFQAPEARTVIVSLVLGLPTPSPSPSPSPSRSPRCSPYWSPATGR